MRGRTQIDAVITFWLPAAPNSRTVPITPHRIDPSAPPVGVLLLPEQPRPASAGSASYTGSRQRTAYEVATTRQVCGIGRHATLPAPPGVRALGCERHL